MTSFSRFSFWLCFFVAVQVRLLQLVGYCLSSIWWFGFWNHPVWGWVVLCELTLPRRMASPLLELLQFRTSAAFWKNVSLSLSLSLSYTHTASNSESCPQDRALILRTKMVMKNGSRGTPTVHCDVSGCNSHWVGEVSEFHWSMQNCRIQKLVRHVMSTGMTSWKQVGRHFVHSLSIVSLAVLCWFSHWLSGDLY